MEHKVIPLHEEEVNGDVGAFQSCEGNGDEGFFFT